MEGNLLRRAIAEFIGTAALLATVVGSGIMAERLAVGNVAVALLANTIATGAALIALILMFANVSGAHLNPVVTFVNVIDGGLKLRDAFVYLLAQLMGALLGTALANLMFELPVFFVSTKIRYGVSQWLGEFIATFGLVGVIVCCTRLYRSTPIVAVAVAAWITAAYWFTSSTSFANPAVTLARSLSDTFAGIRPIDAPMFIVAQFAGAISAAFLFRWLVPKEKI